jgi:hypothetical protein
MNHWTLTVGCTFTLKNVSLIRESWNASDAYIKGTLIFFSSLGGVRLSPLGTWATIWPIVPVPDDRRWVWIVGGMRIGRGNRSTRRKPAPVPLCPPQIPHDLTWDRTRAAAVGCRRLTVWAITRPTLHLLSSRIISLYCCGEYTLLHCVTLRLIIPNYRGGLYIHE